MQIFVHPEGESDLASQDISVRKGQTLDVVVPTNEAGYLPSPPPEVIPNPGVGSTTLTVQNLRPEPVTVFVERGKFDARIGTVAPNRKETLASPESLVRDRPDIGIFVHPERGVDLASQLLPVKVGAHLLVKVPVSAH